MEEKPKLSPARQRVEQIRERVAGSEPGWRDDPLRWLYNVTIRRILRQLQMAFGVRLETVEVTGEQGPISQPLELAAPRQNLKPDEASLPGVPFGVMGNLLTKGGGAVAETAVAGGAKAAAGAAGPVGWALLAKDVIGGLIKGGVGLFKKIIPDLLSKGQIAARQAGDAAVSNFGLSGLAGGVIGFAAGFALGGPVEAIAGSIAVGTIGKLLRGIIKAPGAIAGMLSFAQDKASGGDGFGGKKMGAGAIGLAAAPIAIIVVVLFLLIGARNSQLKTAQTGQRQPTKLTLAIIKVDPAKISPYDGTGATVNVTIRLMPTTSVRINKLTAKTTRYNKDGRAELGEKILLTDKTIDANLELTDTLVVPADDEAYNDSLLSYAVTAEGDTTTSTATTIVLGTPPADQPFGYPATGTITSLDLDPCNPGCHLGTFLDTNLRPTQRHLVWGGLDIAGPSTKVYSTLAGEVISAGFDKDLGGYVYVLDPSKKYLAAFLHLNDPTTVGIKTGTIVTRGQQLGTTYPGTLTYSGGPHLHYQVLVGGLNGANLPFADSFGQCSDQKLLPTQPVYLAQVEQKNVAGTIGCD